MVTLIRTLKRIITSTSPPLPPLTNEFSESENTTVTTGTGTDLIFSANHVHHDGRQKEIETTSDAIEMSNKERAPFDNTTSPQNSSADDTSDEKSAAVDSNKRNTQAKFDRKRKASTDEELATKKAAVNKYNKICSANGCTDVVVQGGVCGRHGAKVKRCSWEGCINISQRGGLCSRHWAKFKRCSGEGCTAYAQNGGVCIRHGTNLLQACLPVADNNSTPSYTEVFEASNAPEVLDLFPDSAAPAHPTSGSIMEYDPSPLGGIFIGQRNLDRLDQQEHQSMQQQQQCRIPQRDYQLKEDVPHFGSSQLHCGNSTNNVVGRNIFGQNIIPAYCYPTRLSIPTDEQFLDPVHNFLRSTCIEVFVSGSGSNLGGIGRGSKSNLVGLCCVHCKHVPKRERAKQAVSYPSKAAHIYESVRNFQRIHLEACAHIPNEANRSIGSWCRKSIGKYF
eukprot:scaffold9684_cov147-Skeletonema_dohrnii-CCMP3373.AAC.3